MAVVATPRVVIADDHVPTRASLGRVLESDGFILIAEVGDADGAIRECRDKKPDVAILDVRMPGNGVRAIEIIKREEPAIEVLMLTISDEDSDLFAALGAGASGYLLKGQDLHLIPGHIRQMLAGEIVLSRQLVKPIIKGWRDRHDRDREKDYAFPGVSFSNRELDIIELLSAGLTTAEIGDRLFIANVTVRAHIASVVKKTGADSRNHLIDQLRNLAHDGTTQAVDLGGF
jgi:two-component system nitrate/nitrite response regulator NarL